MTADSDLIGQGQELFTGAYSLAKTAGFPALVGAATGLVAGLPKGQVATMVAQGASIANLAEGGASVGALLGPYGAAIGAAVGAVMGIVELITGGTPSAPPEGDFRTLAERFCFPARPLPNGAVSAAVLFGSTDPGGTQIGVLPASWPQARQQNIGFQLTASRDPVLTSDGPLTFTFTTGWVPAAESTSESTQVAVTLANAWASQDQTTQALVRSEAYQHFGLSANMLDVEDMIAGNVQSAQLTVFGQNLSLYSQATALLSRWYGTSFPTPAWSATGSMTSDGHYTGNANAAPLAWAKAYRSNVLAVNGASQSDYLYYLAEAFVIQDDPNRNPEQILPILDDPNGSAAQQYQQGMTAIGGEGTGGSYLQMVALPNTLLVGLAELAYLCVTTGIKGAAADLLAFNYALSQCFLWWEGMRIETQVYKTYQGGYFGWLPVTLHPNFARVLGILSGLVKKTAPAAFKAAHTSTTVTTAKPAVAAKPATASGSGASGAKATKTTVVAKKVVPIAAATALASKEELAQGVSLLPKGVSPLPPPSSPQPAPPSTGLSGVAIATGAAVALAGAVLLTRRSK